MPRDYIQRLFAQWRDDTGIVSSPPVGCAPDGFFAEVECAFLNGYQIRWQYLADTIGMGFAQGKTMLWRKADLEKAGGIRELGRTAAEDAASTKIVRAMGLRVRLVEPPVRQPLGKREALAVWHRQRRWARLRRASFPLCFAPEILTTSLVPLTAAAGAAMYAGVYPFAALIAVAILWYGSEAVLAAACGWPLSHRTIPAAIVRDLMLPVLWLDAFLGNGFEWRGTPMHAVESGAGAS
jgi:ceramide glucosyltransferase